MELILIKTANNKLWPADEITEQRLNKISVGCEYVYKVNTKQNVKLHRKVFGFFAFCTKHYYGDVDASKNEYQLDFVRKELTKIAGYHEQLWNRDGTKFKLVAKSLSYDKMTTEEKGEFYKRIIDAALKTVFDKTTDENIINQVVAWF